MHDFITTEEIFFLLFTLTTKAWIAILLWLIRVALVSAYFSTIQALLLSDLRTS